MRTPVIEAIGVLAVLVLVSAVVSAAGLGAACGGTAPDGVQVVPGTPSPSLSGTGDSTPSPVDSASASPSPSPSAARPRTPSATPATASACPSDNAVRSWFYLPNGAHRVPAIPADAGRLLRAYEGRYVGDTEEKVVYLTFDEGYENGYTGRILDALRDAGATAAFFVTGGYVRDNPDLVRRMADEGHVVGNHTDGHPGCRRWPATGRRSRASSRGSRRSSGG